MLTNEFSNANICNFQFSLYIIEQKKKLYSRSFSHINCVIKFCNSFCPSFYSQRFLMEIFMNRYLISKFLFLIKLFISFNWFLFIIYSTMFVSCSCSFILPNSVSFGRFLTFGLHFYSFLIFLIHFYFAQPYHLYKNRQCSTITAVELASAHCTRSFSSLLSICFIDLASMCLAILDSLNFYTLPVLKLHLFFDRKR